MKRAASPIRTTPIALFQRQHLALWQQMRQAPPAATVLSSTTMQVDDYIQRTGASFFGDIVRGTGLLATQVERALAELVAHGRITADGFTGLRALLVPSDRRRPLRGRSNGRAKATFGIEDAGRWATLDSTSQEEPVDPDQQVTFVARLLLRRYGVVFKRVLEREACPLPWRDLLREFRRLEARGEIRGGRFVAGFSGEQYALPEAIGALRTQRREPPQGTLVSLSAADPLNLAGIITPGERVPAYADNRILYEDGVPIAVWIAGEVQVLATLDAARDWQVRQALVQRSVAAPLRGYLKNAG